MLFSHFMYSFKLIFVALVSDFPSILQLLEAKTLYLQPELNLNKNEYIELFCVLLNYTVNRFEEILCLVKHIPKKGFML